MFVVAFALTLFAIVLNMLSKQLISSLRNSGLPADEVGSFFRLPTNVVESCRTADIDQLAAVKGWAQLVELAATETWRTIVGHEAYEVSTFGNVRRDGKLLRPWLNGRGYLTVGLCKNGNEKRRKVHRLVAAAFLGESKLDVLHADDSKTNNRLSNLSYGSRAKNNIDAIKSGCQHKNKSSRYFGVSWHKSKWMVTVNQKHVGYFNSELEAAAAANLAIVTSGSELPLNWL